MNLAFSVIWYLSIQFTTNSLSVIEVENLLPVIMMYWLCLSILDMQHIPQDTTLMGFSPTYLPIMKNVCQKPAYCRVQVNS
jgi:hypothetical protein